MQRPATTAAVLLLAAVAACADYSDPVAADVAPSISGAAVEKGPGATIGTGSSETTTASSDSMATERGPGTFGSGH